jgi:hypothetical protein
MSNQGLYAAGPKRTRHPQQVNGLENTGLAATIAAEKNINPRQVLERYLFDVPDIVYLEAG